MPWNKIRNTTASIIETCVEHRDIGGWETVGLKQAFDAVISPSFLDSDEISGSSPVGVVDPDGTVNSVGFPEGVDKDPPTLGT